MIKMGTSIQLVLDRMLPLIPAEYKSDIQDDIDLAIRGVYDMAYNLGIDELIVTSVDDINNEGESVKTYFANIDLTSSQIHLAAHFAYKAYLYRLKDAMNQEAINFKTLTFEIKGLEKRPEAVNDSIYMVERYLEKEVAKAKGSSSIVGAVRQFGSSSN
jgi:hypothetical protein